MLERQAGSFGFFIVKCSTEKRWFRHNWSKGKYIFKFWSKAWWYTLTVPALRRLRWEDHEYRASLDYIARPCCIKANKKKKKEKTSAYPYWKKWAHMFRRKQGSGQIAFWWGIKYESTNSSLVLFIRWKKWVICKQKPGPSFHSNGRMTPTVFWRSVWLPLPLQAQRAKLWKCSCLHLEFKGCAGEPWGLGRGSLQGQGHHREPPLDPCPVDTRR
jgi:hypothetical protein